MARRKTPNKPSEYTMLNSQITSESLLPMRSKTLVFISHDTRDADLAEAFSNLLLDVSAGTVKSFRSSDKRGISGIEFGAEWYSTIMSQLGSATDVVALLTRKSTDRPWILYEAGVAKGKLEATVFGIALGVPLEKVSTGPFGQFQNSDDSEDSLTRLVMQLLQRNPDADPREEAIRMQVRMFRENVKKILDSEKDIVNVSLASNDEQSSAKLFEEVKAMVRELPDRLSSNFGVNEGALATEKSLAFDHSFIQDMLFTRGDRLSHRSRLLFVASLMRDEIPWLYEGMIQLYKALLSDDEKSIINVSNDIRSMIDISVKNPIVSEIYARVDKRRYMFMRHFPEILTRYLEFYIDKEPLRRPPKISLNLTKNTDPDKARSDD